MQLRKHNCGQKVGWVEDEIKSKVYLLWPGLNLRRSRCVLVWGWRLPARLFKRELHGNSFSVLSDNVGTSLHSRVLEERCWFVHFCVPELMRIVQCAARVHAGLGSWFRASIDCRAERMLSWSSHWSGTGFLAPYAWLLGSSWELAGLSSRGRSCLHQVQN